MSQYFQVDGKGGKVFWLHVWSHWPEGNYLLPYNSYFINFKADGQGCTFCWLQVKPHRQGEIVSNLTIHASIVSSQGERLQSLLASGEAPSIREEVSSSLAHISIISKL